MRIAVYPTKSGDILLRIGRLDVELKREEAEKLKNYLEIANLVEYLKEAKREDIDRFREKIMPIITNRDLSMNKMERSLAIQLMKGYYTEYTLQNIVRLGWRADKEATQQIVREVIEKIKDVIGGKGGVEKWR